MSILKKVISLFLCVLMLISIITSCDTNDLQDKETNGPTTEQQKDTEGGNQPHTHSFDQRKTDLSYQKNSATCTESALYYYSCSCGEKGKDTFSDGEMTSHTESDWIVDKEPNITETGKQHTECTVCGAKLQEETLPTISSKGLLYSVNDDGVSCAITGIGTCPDTEIIIPPVIDGYAVTKIEKNAFENCTSLTSVIIPDGVKEICSGAFLGCEGLTSVTIPDSVTKIGTWGFGFCRKLMEITLSDSVKSIGSSAFAYCSSLTSIKIPSGITSIGSSTFFECTGLTSVTIPGNVMIIGSNAFYRCTGLTSVVIDNGITAVGEGAFAECANLTSIIIPDSVTGIGYIALGYCTSLTSIKYRGTQSQWEAIDKSVDWDFRTEAYTVTYNYTGR